MITLNDWLSQFGKPNATTSGAKRRPQLDPLEARRLMTVVEPVDTLDTSEGANDELQPFVVVLSSAAGEPVLQSPSGTELMGPLTLEETGSGEGYAWVQGSGSGSGYVPGSVLTSSGPLDWESTSSSGGTIEPAGSGWSSSPYSSGSASGSGGSSGSGGYGESSGSGTGSGSGGAWESGYGDASGSGSGGSSGSGYGGSSGSGSGGSSSGGSGSGDPGGSGSGSPGNLPPVIHNFDSSFDDGFYTFTGFVTDDQDPAGLFIIFEGLVSATCQVQANGSFHYVTTIAIPSGEVTAQVQDRELAWSEIETEFI